MVVTCGKEKRYRVTDARGVRYAHITTEDILGQPRDPEEMKRAAAFVVEADGEYTVEEVSE